MSVGRAVAGGVALLASVALALGAAAQTVDVQRPRSLVVGRPPGARADRVDGARAGRTHDALPAASLRVAWQTPVGATLDGAPLVDAHGNVTVVGTRGEVVVLGPDGSERTRVGTGAPQPGPGALLSDDTLVFADAHGEAVAVRDGVVRWRVVFGRQDASHPAPLPLDDGGVVVATAHDLAALDADGRERARVTVREGAAGPLLAAMGRVVVTGVGGAVYTWSPGEPDLARAGHLGATPEGGAAMGDDHTLLAVTASGDRLVSLDLTRGVTTTVAVPGAGVWLGPPAAGAGKTYVGLLGATAELVFGVDANGAEVMRMRIASHAATTSADGGAPLLVPLAHAAPLVDAAGTVAFATLDGAVGIATTTTVELVDDPCSFIPHAAPGAASRVVGLAPLGPGAFVLACRGGGVVAITSASGGAASPPLPHRAGGAGSAPL